jgi:hypothetical protein
VGNRIGLQVSGIDSHSAVFRLLYRFPVRDAATGDAANELKSLVTPGVALQSSGFSANRDVVELVIRPERTVATTDRAVAACQPAWPSRDIKANRAAMTGRSEHC